MVSPPHNFFQHKVRRKLTHFLSPHLSLSDGRASVVRHTCFERDVEDFEWKEHKGVMLHMMCECKLSHDGLVRKPYRLEQKSLNGFGPTVGVSKVLPFLPPVLSLCLSFHLSDL